MNAFSHLPLTLDPQKCTPRGVRTVSTLSEGVQTISGNGLFQMFVQDSVLET